MLGTHRRYNGGDSMHAYAQRHAHDAVRNAEKIWYAGSSALGLCAAYNFAMRSDIPTTKHEHKRRCQYVGAILARMSRLDYVAGLDYIVTQDGTRFPVKRVV